MNCKITHQILNDLYHIQKKRIKQIAKELNVGKTTIRRWMKKFNIPIRPRTTDLTGQTIGKWFVIYKIPYKKDNDNHAIWRVKCVCGYESDVVDCALRNGESNGCNSCKYKSGNKHRNWKGCGELSATHWTRIKDSAKSKGRRKNRTLEFDLTIDYVWNLFVEQNRRCAITNLPLQFGSYTIKKETTASLDRIDSSKGYIKGNVQWVHKTINKMKQDIPLNKFKEFCKLVACPI